MVGTACVFSWVYLKSNSIWAPTIMHLSWNFFRGVLTGRLSDGEPGLFNGDLWMINGEGVIGMIVTALTGLIFIFLFRSYKEKS
jgi:membrane protease YdiL (CAAX protease family)